jgi:protein-disulfide isomerase
VRRWGLALPLALAGTLAIIAVLAAGLGSLTVAPGLLGWQTAMTRELSTVPQHGLTLGRLRAPVTVTEYADLRCGYCQVYALTVLPLVVHAYVQTGQVKLVFHPVAMMGPESRNAARAATAAAAQNKLWDFLDAFYYREQNDASSAVTDTSLHDVATAAGLDVSQLMRQRTSGPVLALTQAQAREARSAGVTRIPTFVITRTGFHGASRVVGYGPLLDALRRAVSAHA